MGTNSGATRSGQNSSGKRNTRSTATPSISSPTTHTIHLASPSSPRPGSAHKKHTTVPRGACRTAASAKRKPTAAARQPPHKEEILAEIIVSTNGLDEVDVKMSEGEAEPLNGAGLPAGPSSNPPFLVYKAVSPDISHAKELASQPPSIELVSVEDEGPRPVVETASASIGLSKEHTLPSSTTEPSPDGETIDERASQLHVRNDATQQACPEGEDAKDSFSKDKIPRESTQEESTSAKTDSVTSATAAVAAETSEEQVPQPDIQNDSPQDSPARAVTPGSPPQITLVADHSLAEPITAEPELDVLIIATENAESAEQQASQLEAVTQFLPVSQGTLPNPSAEEISSTNPIPEASAPASFESDISQAALANPGVHYAVEPEGKVEDSAAGESSGFDEATQAGTSYEHFPNLGSFDRIPTGEEAPNLSPLETLPGKSGLLMHRYSRLTPTAGANLSSSPGELLPTQVSSSNGILEEVGAASPAEQSELMDTDLDDPVPSNEAAMLDLDDNPLPLKLQRVIDPSIIPPLETLPRPISSNLKPGSSGLMSNDDIEKAFEEVAKADAKATDTLLNNKKMVEVTCSDSTTATTATASSGLGKGCGNGPPESHNLVETTSVVQPSTPAANFYQTPAKSTLKQIIGESRNSFASSSSLSALTDLSGLSSKPPSLSSKATTPFDADSPRETLGHYTSNATFQVRSAAPRLQYNVRPRVSIPADLTPQEYAMECIEAGENSRLNPYALQQEEYLMLRSHISHGQVTTYLNIRNGILRLWVRNPQIAVTREEAIGCAKDTRWFDVANVCFDWLVRRGYINYGCVEIRQSKGHVNEDQPRKQRTIVVIGAGFSGLGCARQLEGLFKQYSKRFREMGEEPPRVVILEGRKRVGGRVYSRAFETLPATAPGVMRGRRFTAEMGGMIITGFERGNPLNILVRGQLGLPYHCLLADMSLHDSNGTNVDLQRDTLVEQLYNACLERVSEYKFKTQPTKLIEGNHDLLDEGRDSSAEGHKTIALIEETTAAQPHAPPVSEQNIAPQVDLVPVSTNRMTGKVHAEPGTAGSTKAAFKAKQIGWTLKAGVNDARDIDLDPAVNNSKSTLGSVLDNALMQYKDILDLNAQDFRLFNWHIANLEYSNATNLNRLSSRGWDVDVGNEWDGRHTMVVGGYQSVARGLATLPAPLNIQYKAAVKRIRYAPDGSSGPARITLEDGKLIDADYVVNTIPLGVLKHGNVEFQPPLPSWKTQAIERLGFGVLNKVILVFKEAFWDKDRDIFGMLQTPTNRSSLNQKDYAARRGRFFQWFSVTNTTGMPCLLALMAGDAAYDTEITPNDELIAEATEVLRMRYGARVTQPLEAIVTRWESDRFARGSYSNAGVNMQPDDYQLMARTIGNLYFAGEHTIVTHPATVHGAYLSGLRAASDVLDAMLGPIDIPTPLVLPRETSASLKRKAQEEHKDPAHARLEAYEMEITEHIHATIGYYPLKPAKVAGNPYILFNKANYEIGRKKCEEGRRAGKGKPSPNEVRTMTSKMWKEASPEVRKPFEDAAEEQKRGFATALGEWTEAAAKWEREALALREQYVKEHPSMPGPEEADGSNDWGGARRAKRMVESYREEDSDADMD